VFEAVEDGDESLMDGDESEQSEGEDADHRHGKARGVSDDSEASGDESEESAGESVCCAAMSCMVPARLRGLGLCVTCWPGIWQWLNSP
jgi:hypothetical protein